MNEFRMKNSVNVNICVDHVNSAKANMTDK